MTNRDFDDLLKACRRAREAARNAVRVTKLANILASDAERGECLDLVDRELRMTRVACDSALARCARLRGES